MLSAKLSQRLLARRSLVSARPQLRSVSASVTITEGVEFDTIAREWRLKWSPDNEKSSLAAVQVPGLSLALDSDP